MALLNRQQCTLYEEQGYLIVRDVLTDDDLSLVRSAVERHVDEQAHTFYAEGKIAERYEKLPFTHRLTQLYQHRSRKSIGWNREVFSREIYDFGMLPQILDIAESLVGPELQFNGDYWIRTKLPGDSVTTFPWHQDSGYYGDPTPFHILSLWIPLVDVDEENGCMQVIPGSHRWGLLPVGRDDEGHHVPLEELEKRGEVVTLPMKAGEIFAFHNLTIHRSLMNRTDGIRWSIDLRYSETGMPLVWLWKCGLNGFVARSRKNPDQVDAWEGWQEKRRLADIEAGR
ncbi:MAG: phytanoyl-CoA dioxygenase family protein [candidate division Zixibacteria bacterium]|nr:phytanoyl-CoA dioxygenase family protein [candidate division Zixibacteria bacterium]